MAGLDLTYRSCDVVSSNYIVIYSVLLLSLLWLLRERERAGRAGPGSADIFSAGLTGQLATRRVRWHGGLTTTTVITGQTTLETPGPRPSSTLRHDHQQPPPPPPPAPAGPPPPHRPLLQPGDPGPGGQAGRGLRQQLFWLQRCPAQDRGRGASPPDRSASGPEPAAGDWEVRGSVQVSSLLRHHGLQPGRHWREEAQLGALQGHLRRRHRGPANTSQGWDKGWSVAWSGCQLTR